MTEQDLRQALSEFGNVVSVRILRDQDKRSRGVGFARMNDKKQCQEIIDQFHNKTFPSLFLFQLDFINEIFRFLLNRFQ
jgi:RNA recognition motif-containing protein